MGVGGGTVRKARRALLGKHMLLQKLYCKDEREEMRLRRSHTDGETRQRKEHSQTQVRSYISSRKGWEVVGWQSTSTEGKRGSGGECSLHASMRAGVGAEIAHR